MRLFFGLLALMLGISPAMAGQCDCRPDLPVDSTGPGTCRKVQNGSQLCKLDWDAGTSREESLRTLEQLRKFGFNTELGIDFAAANLFKTERSDMTVSAMALLMAASLVRYAPERLPLAAAFSKKYSDVRFRSILLERQDKIEKDKLEVGDKTYDIALSFGCAQARDGSFLLMIKTRFSPRQGNCDDGLR